MTLTAKQSAFLDEFLLDLNGKLRFGRDIAKERLRPPTILFNTVGRSVVLSIVGHELSTYQQTAHKLVTAYPPEPETVSVDTGTCRRNVNV